MNRRDGWVEAWRIDEYLDEPMQPCSDAGVGCIMACMAHGKYRRLAWSLETES